MKKHRIISGLAMAGLLVMSVPSFAYCNTVNWTHANGTVTTVNHCWGGGAVIQATWHKNCWVNYWGNQVCHRWWN